jgi:hypothetical protein
VFKACAAGTLRAFAVRSSPVTSLYVVTAVADAYIKIVRLALGLFAEIRACSCVPCDSPRLRGRGYRVRRGRQPGLVTARGARALPQARRRRDTLHCQHALRRHVLRVQRRWGQRSAPQSSVLTPLPQRHAHPVLHVQAAMSAALCAKLCVDASPYVANTLTTFYTRSRNVGGALVTVRHAPTCRLAAVGRPYRRSSQCFVARHHQLMHNQTNICRPGSLYICSL